MDNFTELVVKMREAQKAYSRNRSLDNFNDAKHLETLVDREIERLKMRKEEKPDKFR